MSDLRVLVVSPNAFARAGLASMLAGMPGTTVVASCGVAEAGSLAGQVLPDVALVDAGEGEPEDLDRIARLSTVLPDLPIIALADDLAGLPQALSFGASSLLPAGVDSETLVAAMVGAARSLVSFPRRELASVMPADEPLDPTVKAPVESLTARELEVLQWMARGLTNRQIARRLQISEHTVKFHAAAILGKIGARSRAEAVARAIGLGWILV
jgi:DNA-binding NarL/FixJ family response regulator